jgi:hypothetical protein
MDIYSLPNNLRKCTTNTLTNNLKRIDRNVTSLKIELNTPCPVHWVEAVVSLIQTSESLTDFTLEIEYPLNNSDDHMKKKYSYTDMISIAEVARSIVLALKKTKSVSRVMFTDDAMTSGLRVDALVEMFEENTVTTHVLFTDTRIVGGEMERILDAVTRGGTVTTFGFGAKTWWSTDVNILDPMMKFLKTNECVEVIVMEGLRTVSTQELSGLLESLKNNTKARKVYLPLVSATYEGEDIVKATRRAEKELRDDNKVMEEFIPCNGRFCRGEFFSPQQK